MITTNTETKTNPVPNTIGMLLLLWLTIGNQHPGVAQVTPNPPIVSLTGGFYDAPITVFIFTYAPNLTILYTLDGSEPHPDNVQATTYQIKTGYQRHPTSPAGSFTTDSLKTWVYSEPLLFEDATPQPNRYSRVNTTWDQLAIYAPFATNPKAVVLRTRTLSADGGLSQVVTHTYFVRSRPDSFVHSLPVVSVSISPDRLFSYESGIYVPGAEFDRWRDENPSTSAHAFSSANYTLRGTEAEHPGSFEYFVGGSRVFSQHIGFRIHGGATRSFPLKSLRMYARNSYSTNTLNHAFFGYEHDDQFRRLILRNNGDDFLRGLLRDRYHHRMMQHLGVENQLDQPVVAYLNGEYWGLMAIRERIDRHYLNRRFGLDDAPIDLLTHNMVADEGSATHFQQMMHFVEQHDLSDPEQYAILGTMMDIDNYIRYITAQMYIANFDWPQNNIRYWRTTQTIADSPGKDGRWRWIFFDTDIGSLSTFYTVNMIEHLVSADESIPWAKVLPARLMQNETFRNELLNRVAEELNMSFSSEVLIGLMHELRDEIADEVGSHIGRWKRPLSVTAWEESVEEIETFIHNRPAYMRNHLAAFFQLDGIAEVQLDQSQEGAGAIHVHTAVIQAGEHATWSGQYFRGVPVRVEAIPADGYKFMGWKPPFEHEPAVFTLIPSNELITLQPEFALDSSTPDEKREAMLPSVYLLANSPNPFNPTTDISVRINGEAAFVQLTVYDTMGRQISRLVEDRFPAGTHTFRFEAGNLSSGVYVYVLESQSYRQSRFMTLIR